MLPEDKRYIEIYIRINSYLDIECYKYKYFDSDFLSKNHIEFLSSHFYSLVLTSKTRIIYFDLKYEDLLKDDPSYIAWQIYIKKNRIEKLKKIYNDR